MCHWHTLQTTQWVILSETTLTAGIEVAVLLPLSALLYVFVCILVCFVSPQITLYTTAAVISAHYATGQFCDQSKALGETWPGKCDTLYLTKRREQWLESALCLDIFSLTFPLHYNEGNMLTFTLIQAEIQSVSHTLPHSVSQSAASDLHRRSSEGKSSWLWRSVKAAHGFQWQWVEGLKERWFIAHWRDVRHSSPGTISL